MTTKNLTDLRGSDIFDSRDMIARIAWLDGTDDPDEAEELSTLVAFAAEAEGYASDWQYGESFIRDSYFKEYAQELAEEIGAIPDDLSWPATCIDWDQAADELQMDYTSVELDGVTFWTR